jgi:hypothetical protein
MRPCDRAVKVTIRPVGVWECNESSNRNSIVEQVDRGILDSIGCNTFRHGTCDGLWVDWLVFQEISRCGAREVLRSCIEALVVQRSELSKVLSNTGTEGFVTRAIAAIFCSNTGRNVEVCDLCACGYWS